MRTEGIVNHRRMVAGLCVAVTVALVAAAAGVLTAPDGGSKRVQATSAPATTASKIGGTAGVASPTTGDAIPAAPGPTPAPTVAPGAAQVLGTSFTRPGTSGQTTTSPTTRSQPGQTSQIQPAGRQSTFAGSQNPTPATTTPPPECRNSSDPSCGPFYWDPDPGPNAPITGQVSFSPPNPKAGDEVTFHIVFSDADASPVRGYGYAFGDDSPSVHADPKPDVAPSTCPPQYGPWTPPARQGDSGNWDAPHTYSQSGTYHASFYVLSAGEECNNPYKSAKTFDIDVVVN